MVQNFNSYQNVVAGEWYISGPNFVIYENN